MKLSDSQIRALKKLRPLSATWQTPYDLKESRITLDSLVRKGLVEREYGAGAYAFPRVGNHYRLTHVGEIERGKHV